MLETPCMDSHHKTDCGEGCKTDYSGRVPIKFKMPSRKPSIASPKAVTSSPRMPSTPGRKLVQYDSDSDDDGSGTGAIQNNLKRNSGRCDDKDRNAIANQSSTKHNRSTEALRKSASSPTQDHSKRNSRTKESATGSHPGDDRDSKKNDETGHRRRSKHRDELEPNQVKQSGLCSVEEESPCKNRDSRCKRDSHTKDSSRNRSESNRRTSASSKNTENKSKKMEICILDEMSPDRKLSELEIRKKKEDEKIIFYNLVECSEHHSPSHRRRKDSVEECKHKDDCKEENQGCKSTSGIVHESSKRDRDKDPDVRKRSRTPNREGSRDATRYQSRQRSSRGSRRRSRWRDDSRSRQASSGRKRSRSSSSSGRHRRRSRSTRRRLRSGSRQRRGSCRRRSSSGRGSKHRDSSRSSRSRKSKACKRRSLSRSSSSPSSSSSDRESRSRKLGRDLSKSRNKSSCSGKALNEKFIGKEGMHASRQEASFNFCESLEDIPLPDSVPLPSKESKNEVRSGNRACKMSSKMDDHQVIDLDESDVEVITGDSIKEKSQRSEDIRGNNIHNSGSPAIHFKPDGGSGDNNSNANNHEHLNNKNNKIAFSMKDSKRLKLIPDTKDIFREDSDDDTQREVDKRPLAMSGEYDKLIRTPVRKESNLIGLREILSPGKNNSPKRDDSCGHSIPVITSRMTFHKPLPSRSPDKVRCLPSVFSMNYLPQTAVKTLLSQMVPQVVHSNLLYPVVQNSLGPSLSGQISKMGSRADAPLKMLPKIANDLDIFSPEEPPKGAAVIALSQLKPSQLVTDRRPLMTPSGIQRMRPRRVFEEYPDLCNLPSVVEEKSLIKNTEAVSHAVDAIDVENNWLSLEMKAASSGKLVTNKQMEISSINQSELKSQDSINEECVSKANSFHESKALEPANEVVSTEMSEPKVNDELECESEIIHRDDSDQGVETENIKMSFKDEEMSSETAVGLECKLVENLALNPHADDALVATMSCMQESKEVVSPSSDMTLKLSEEPVRKLLGVTHATPGESKRKCLWWAVMSQECRQRDEYDPSDSTPSEQALHSTSERRRSSRLMSKEGKKGILTAQGVVDNSSFNQRVSCTDASDVKAGRPPSHSDASESLCAKVPASLSAAEINGNQPTLQRPEKVKSRWWRNSELETDRISNTSQQENISEESASPTQATVVANPSTPALDPTASDNLQNNIQLRSEALNEEKTTKKDDESPTPFVSITENIYLSERDLKKQKKESRRMVCDCVAPSPDDVRSGAVACGEDCLNRMLMIECSSRCPCGDLCTNRQFAEKSYASTKCFKTDWKGWGLQADQDIPEGTFIMEYVGEVLDYKEFKSRTRKYDRERIVHHYFMALNGEEVIDATRKGNVSRFINHCCDPNAETQKWTVNGQLRVGFFSVKPIKKGEEITFNYQFESYGSEQIKCYCNASTCRGTIGINKSTPLKSRKGRSAKSKKKKSELFSDQFLDSEIEDMVCRGGLLRKSHVLELNRLMLRADTSEHRLSLLRVIQDTKETACLRLFIEYHGLQLLWSWMVDISPEADGEELKSQVIATLKKLPINNKTVLKNTRILPIIEKWSQKPLDRGPSGDELPIDVRSPDDPRSVALNKTLALLKEQGAMAGSSEGSSADVVRQTQRKEEANEESERNSPDEVIKAEREMEEGRTSREDNMEVEVDNNVDNNALGDWNKEKDSTIGDDKMEISEVEMEDKDDDIASNGSRPSRTSDVEPPSKSRVPELAQALLDAWRDLKEVFKIPKIKVEERKKTELELDLRCENNELKRTYKGWDKVLTTKRPAEDGDPLKTNAKRKKVGEEEFKNNKPIKNRSISHSHSSENLTKLEYRQQFEAQFKAKEQQKAELAKQQQQQVLQQQQHQKQKHLQKQSASSTDINLTSNASNADQASYPITTILKSQDSTPPTSSSSLSSLSSTSSSFMNQHHQYYLVPDQDPSKSSLAFVPDHSFRRAQDAALQMSGLLYNQEFQAPGMTPTNTPTDVSTPTSMNLPKPILPPPFHHPPITYVSDRTGFAFPEAHVQPAGVQDLSLIQFLDPSGNLIIANSQVLQAQPPMIYPNQTASVIIQPPHPAYPPSIFGNPSSSDPSVVPLGIYTQGSALVSQVNEYSLGVKEVQDPPPPPPSPPKQRKLPPNWKSAKDSTGKVYYYHTITRQTQWEPPLWDFGSANDSSMNGSDRGMDSSGESHDIDKERTTTTAPADTSSSEEVAKKIKDQFRSRIARHVVNCLEPYKKSDCKLGRITSTVDFKYLARKITHAIMSKEMRQCRHVEDLEVNEKVKFKAKDYINSYMSKFGPIYQRGMNSHHES